MNIINVFISFSKLVCLYTSVCNPIYVYLYYDGLCKHVCMCLSVSLYSYPCNKRRQGEREGGKDGGRGKGRQRQGGRQAGRETDRQGGRQRGRQAGRVDVIYYGIAIRGLVINWQTRNSNGIIVVGSIGRRLFHMQIGEI